MNNWYRWDGEALHLMLHIQPRASRDEICGPHGDRLKIRITAPPIDGRANSHLCRFLATQFGVAQSSVSLLSGGSGREKQVRIDGPQRLPDSIPYQE